MYKGFVLDSDLINNKCNTESECISLEQHETYNKLEELIKNTELVNGNLLPIDKLGEFHAFISHAHKDTEISIKFSNWLENKFRIRSFIDSKYWNHCDNIIKNLKNEYPDSKDYIASHIHNILLISLAKMIDSCEVFFFIRSDSSLCDSENTLSPWIYSELQLTKILRKNIPKRIKTRGINEELKTSLESLKIEYPALLSELYQLDDDVLKYWESCSDNSSPSKSLDNLYNVIRVNSKYA